jgi:hypothetical protein
VTVAPPAFGAKLTATTDKDGKFRLTGAGRDRVLTVRVTGKGIEHKFFWVVTRPDAPKEGYLKTRDLNLGLFGPEVLVLVGPSKPLVGTIRDRATGKAIAGVTVQEAHYHVASKAVSDAEGHYRLEGVSKTASYTLIAYGKKGVPYFDNTQMDVQDTAGFDPITVDFKMYRGVEVTGRVTEKATGKPVAALVMYFQSQDNPIVKTDPPPHSPLVYSAWGRIDPDGAYSILALPGKGGVIVESKAAQARAISFIEPDEKKPESLVLNVELLAAGRTRKGTVLGPDDKPLEGVHAAGLVPDESPKSLKTSAFTLPGLGERKRLLVFLQREKNLGVAVVASSDSDDPVTVKLQPLGTVEGTVVDGDGKPWAGLKVKLMPEVSREDYDSLPLEQRAIQGRFGIHRGLWLDFVSRDATTDKDGRFRVEGVLPGVNFVLYVSDGDLAKERTLVSMKKGVRVESGKTTDLGPLKKGDGMKVE